MMNEDEAVQRRYSEIQHVAEAVVEKLQAETIKLGFEAAAPLIKNAAEARYRLEKDPYSKEDSLVGEWLDDKGMKQGSLLFHGDGSFFVEYDVVKPHPAKPRWFVEAVNAWGKDTDIKAEARLLPLPE